VNDLGLVIKKLQRKHGLNGQGLANLIGITPPNLSQIVNGHAKPRQGTFSKLCKVLGKDKADEKMLVDAFVRLAEDASESVVLNSADYEKSEIERAERYLEMKAQSISFKRSVKSELDKAKIDYEQDFCKGIYVTDFLVSVEGKRIALECKFNMHRDIEKTITSSRLIYKYFNCHLLFIVLPFYDERIAVSFSGEKTINTVGLQDLVKELSIGENL